MNILIVTDNRYWRGEIGSHKRIQALCTHFMHAGHTVKTFFVGRLWPHDEAALGERPLDHALLVAPAEAAPAPDAGSPQRTWSWRRCVPPLFRRAAKQALANLRRPHDPAHPAIYRRFALQIKEPKLADFYSSQHVARFRDALLAEQPDVVCVEYARLAYLLEAAANALPPRCLKIIDTHDVQYERQSRFHERGDVHDIDITPAEEAAALAQADILLAIQARDGEKLSALVPQRRVIVTPHPHPLAPQADPGGTQLRIGFFGSDMAPNRQAALTLINAIWPEIARRYPEAASLHLYGSVCRVIDAAACPASVHLEGFVDDLAAAYGRLHVVANPVDFGGGLKIKCVEALCYGKPLVTTQVGAEGMEDGAGSAMIIANTAAETIATFDTLLASQDAREQWGRAALAYAQAHFSPEAAFRELDAALAHHSQAIEGEAVR